MMLCYNKTKNKEYDTFCIQLRNETIWLVLKLYIIDVDDNLCTRVGYPLYHINEQELNTIMYDKIRS